MTTDYPTSEDFKGVRLTDGAISEIADFLQDRDPNLAQWSGEDMEGLLSFAAFHRAIGIVRRAGVMVGVGVASPVMHNRIGFPWEWNEFGDTLWIQDIATDGPEIIPILWGMMVGRFGRRDYAAGRRHGKLFSWDFVKYERTLMRAHLKGRK